MKQNYLKLNTNTAIHRLPPILLAQRSAASVQYFLVQSRLFLDLESKESDRIDSSCKQH